ncbi:MAG: type II secretion system GspH family protein [Leptospiraceae bacterium]|nr:type II secretion system GspH family protein [Leptospiraceae bacterium]MDW8306758.1 type II secretion system protein [Leptospiraceae bacterium]
MKQKNPIYFPKKEAFTLIEILVALGILGTLLGMILSVLMKGLSLRQESSDITRAVFLAEEKMNEIKTIVKPDSGHGEYESFPGYSYAFEIVEEELDLAKLVEELGAGERLEQTEAAKYLRRRQGSDGATTGLVFKLLRYTVKIFYPENRQYELSFYRGLGIF